MLLDLSFMISAWPMPASSRQQMMFREDDQMLTSSTMILQFVNVNNEAVCLNRLCQCYCLQIHGVIVNSPLHRRCRQRKLAFWIAEGIAAI